MDGKDEGTIPPRVAAEEALAYLRAHADDDRAAKLQRYFKDPGPRATGPS
jgi:hypothetical protein